MTAPMIGEFIRPVPAASYCYQILKVITENAEGQECIFCKRFGYDNQAQRPVQDGDQDIQYLYGLKQISGVVWKDEWEFDTPRLSCVPLAWKKMPISDVQRPANSHAIQLSIF